MLKRSAVMVVLALGACASEPPPATTTTTAPALSCAELQQAFDVANAAVADAAEAGDNDAARTPASVMAGLDRQMRAAGCYDG